MHHLPGDTLNVPSGKTVYVAGGAVIKGRIQVVDAQDVKILGRGLVLPERWAGIRIVHSKNVLVEGLITTQCPTGGSDSITIRNLKVISSYGWGDGLNVLPVTIYCSMAYSVVIRTIALRSTAPVWALPVVAKTSLCRTLLSGQM